MSTLYDIKGEFMQLYELATEDGDEQAFLDTLESLKGDLANKAADYIRVMKQLAMESKECDIVADTFKCKKLRRDKAYKRMNDALMEAMQTAGIEELDAGEYKLKIVNNGGVLPLEITGEVPDNFLKVSYEPDKAKIREALQYTELPFAHFGEKGKRLNIN